MKKISIVMVQYGLGGSVKRYYRLFNYLVAHHEIRIKLYINQKLLLELYESVGKPHENLEIECIHTSRLMRLFGLTTNELFELPLIFKLPYSIKNLIAKSYQLGRRVVHWIGFPTRKIAKAEQVHWVTGFCPGAQASLLKSNTVFSVYDFQIKEFHWRHFYIRKAYANGVIFDALSAEIAEDLNSIVRARGSRKIKVAPGSFIPDFDEEDVEKNNIIAFAGRFSPVKQPILFVKAAIMALNNGLDAEFLMLGDGGLKKEVLSLINESEYKSKFEVRWSDDTLLEFPKCSVFASVQKGNNYPSQVLLEAMACGCAVVATDEGETYKLVNEENGILTESTVESIAEGFMRIFDDKDKLSKRQQKSRRIIAENHTIKNYADYVLSELYETQTP